MLRAPSSLGISGLALCLLCGGFSLVSAQEPKDSITSKTAEEAGANLDLQLAKARLDLAKVELEHALTVNERTPGTYSIVAVELLRRNVGIAEARLVALKQSGETDLHSAHLRELESALKIAELKWKEAVRLHRQLPDSDASQVESLRLRAEVARLALARARDPARVATPLDHIQWQLDQLRQGMLDLSLRVEKLSNKR